MPNTKFTIDSSKIPGLDKIPTTPIDPGDTPKKPPVNPPNDKWHQERDYISYVLEIPDDNGIDRHRQSIKKVLEETLPMWRELVEDKEVQKEVINTMPRKELSKLKKVAVSEQKIGLSKFFKNITKFTQNTVESKNKFATIFDTIKKSTSSNTKGYDFEIEELFEGSASLKTTNNQLYSMLNMHRFYVLKLDLDYHVLEQTLGIQTDALLQELKYNLQRQTQLEKVTADIYMEGRMSSDAVEPDISQVAHDWHLTTMRAQRAGSAPHIPTTTNGQGVVIAHPDTGYTKHSELNTDPITGKSPNIDYNKQYNVFTLQNNAEESLAEGFDKLKKGQLPGFHDHHGTAILTSIISSHEPAVTDRGDVKGVAPGAQIIPIRCVTSVILFSGINVARAIFYATNNGADVISMSLGGIGSKFFQAALKYAEFMDVICVAAAGNVTPIVFAPGIYPETICMAGINALEKPWKDTAQGCAVDLAAPASEVNRGAWKFDEQTKQASEFNGISAGTSYATAHCAGAAALWLQTHGKQNMQQQLVTRASLLEYFRKHVTTTARKPQVWDDQRMGAGILNIQGLVDPAQLPDPLRFNNPIKINPLFMSSVDTIAKQLCPIVSRQEALELIEDIFGPEARNRLEEFGEEVEAIFAKFDEVKDAFINGLRERTKAFIDEVVARLRALMQTASEAARAAIQRAIQALNDLRTNVENAVEEAMSVINDTLANIEQFVANVLAQLNETFENIVREAQEAARQAQDWFEDVRDLVVDFASDTLDDVIPA